MYFLTKSSQLLLTKLHVNRLPVGFDAKYLMAVIVLVAFSAKRSFKYFRAKMMSLVHDIPLSTSRRC